MPWFFFRFSRFFSLYFASFKFYMDICQTKNKFEAFFPIARLIHNLYSEQWSMLTKIRWPHQGAMHAKEEKKIILAYLFPSIIHTQLYYYRSRWAIANPLAWSGSSQFELNKTAVLPFFTFRLGIFQKCHKQPSEFRMCVCECVFADFMGIISPIEL